MLIDSFGRKLTYLRVSLTDRCNLRCKYCMPDGLKYKLGHEDILTYEEFLTIIQAAVSEGVNKVRLTGGEPLTRKNMLHFASELGRLPEKPTLALTTNGVLLAEMARDLKKAGVSRVNISLDSLDRSVFHYLSGEDEFDRVWRGLETALSAGFKQVKVNMVVIRGVNDQEVTEMARLTLDRPLEVRFIEYMPLGTVGYWSEEKLVSSMEIREKLKTLGELAPLASLDGDGPANKYRLAGAEGIIGFISPVTEHFCESCNRLRLTADGKLRLCLLSNLEIDVKTPLRSGATQADLVNLLKQAALKKPRQHYLRPKISQASNRPMNLIGG